MIKMKKKNRSIISPLHLLGILVLVMPAIIQADWTPPPQPGQFRFSASAYSVSENQPSIIITVQRINGSDGYVTVNYATSNLTAVAGEDYEYRSGILSWQNGDSSNKTFTIPILNDNLYEGNETFKVILSNPTGGATLASPNQATVTIIEDDPPPTVSVKYARVYVLESAGTAWVTVELSTVSGLPVSVNYATQPGTALPGDDYGSVSDILTIQAGETENTIPITIIDNQEDHQDKEFSLILSNPVNAILGETNQPIMILDEEKGLPSMKMSVMENDPVMGYIGEGIYPPEGGNPTRPFILQTGPFSPDTFTVKGRLGDPCCEFRSPEVLCVGNLDGDGYDDLVIGEISHGGHIHTMEVGIFFGGDDLRGQVVDLHSQEPDILIYGTESWYGIKGLECGDFSADGYDDLIISYNDRYYLINGRSRGDWPVQINLDSFNSSEGALITPPNESTTWDVAVGNIDGDEFEDLILGCIIQPLDERQLPISGERDERVYIIFGGENEESISGNINLDSLNLRHKIISAGLGVDMSFGQQIDAGDFTKDGLDDVMIGAPDAEPFGIQNAGLITYASAELINSTPGILICPCEWIFYNDAGEQIGRFFTMGDVNNDGRDDLIIGSPNAGKVYIVFGKEIYYPEPLFADLDILTDVLLETHYTGWGFWGLSGSFGEGVSVTDQNGDGFEDIIVGAPEQSGDYDTGFVYIVNGRTTAQWELNNHIYLDPDIIGGASEIIALSGQSLGAFVMGGADLDLDGFADISAQSPWYVRDPIVPSDCSGLVCTAFGMGDSTGSASGAEYFPINEAGTKGMGGRLSPTLRTRISFAGGHGASNPEVPSQIIATLNRTAPTIGGLLNPADVHWIVDCTDRIDFTTANLTFQYLDSEIAALNENELRLYYYSIPEYQWEAVTDQHIDLVKNEISGVVYYFELQYPLTFALSDDPNNLHAPDAPETISPTLNTELVAPLPQLVAGIPNDPDGLCALTYDFHIFDAEGNTLYRNFTQVFDAADPENAFYDRVRHQVQISPPLAIGESYFWRVRVRDPQNHCSAWSLPEEFIIRYGYVGVEGRWFKRELAGSAKETFIPNGPNMWGSGMAYAGWIDNIRDRFYWELGGPGDQFLCNIREHGVNVLHLYVDNTWKVQSDFLIQEAYSNGTTTFNADVIEDIDIFLDALERNGIYYTMQMLVAVPGLDQEDLSGFIWFNTTIKGPGDVPLIPGNPNDRNYFLTEFLDVDTTENPEHHIALSDRVEKYVTQWGARPGLIGWIPALEHNLFYLYLPGSDLLQYKFAKHYYNLINTTHNTAWPDIRKVPITYSEANISIFPYWIDPARIPPGEPIPLDFRDMHLYTGGVGVDPDKYSAITPSNAVGPIIEPGGLFNSLFSPSSPSGTLYTWSKNNQKPVISMESGPFGWEPEWLATGSQHWYLPRWIYEQGNHNMVMMAVACGHNGAPGAYFSGYYLHLPLTDYERNQWDIFGNLYRDGNSDTPIYLHPEELFRTHACVTQWLSLLDLENIVDADYDCVTKNQDSSDNIYIVQPDPAHPDHKIFASSDGRQAIGWLLHYNEDDKKHFWERPGELEPDHFMLGVDERPTIYIKGLLPNTGYYIRWYHDETMTSNDVSYVTDGYGNLTVRTPGYKKHVAFAAVPQSSSEPIAPRPDLVLSHEARVVGDASNPVVNIHEEFPDVHVGKQYNITQIIPSPLSALAKSYYHTLKLKHPDVPAENLWPSSTASPPNLPNPIPWTPQKPGVHHLVLIDELRESPGDPEPVYILKDQIDVTAHENKTTQGRRFWCSFNNFPWNSEHHPVWRPGSDWTYRPIQATNVLTQHITFNLGSSFVMQGVPFGCYIPDPEGFNFAHALFPFRSMTHKLQDYDMINPHRGTIDFYIMTNWGSKEILDQPDPTGFLTNYYSMIRAFSKHRNTPNNHAFGILFDAGRLFNSSNPTNPCASSPTPNDLFFIRFLAKAASPLEATPYVWYSFSDYTPLQDHWPANIPLRVTLSWDLQGHITNMRIVRLDTGYELGQDPLMNCFIDGIQRDFLISGTNPDPRYYNVRPYTFSTDITDGKMADCRIYENVLTPTGLRVGDFTSFKDVPLNDNWISAQNMGNFVNIGPQEIVGHATDSIAPEYPGIDFSPYSNVRDVWFFTNTTPKWTDALAIFEAGNDSELYASALYAYEFDQTNNLICIKAQMTTSHSGDPDINLSFLVNDVHFYHNMILWRLRTAAKSDSIFPITQKFNIILEK